jgi:hypothetical protein
MGVAKPLKYFTFLYRHLGFGGMRQIGWKNPTLGETQNQEKVLSFDKSDGWGGSFFFSFLVLGGI